ncbi:MAG: hypothetical protein V4572_05830 [Bacteroidota bacterium]
MKKFITQSFVAILFLSFIGCSSDDSEKNPDEETPTTKTVMKINKVTVTQMPFTDSNGADWDTGNGPDIEFSIRDTGDISYLRGPSTFNNVISSQLPFAWTGMTSLSVSTSKNIFVQLLEDDGAPAKEIIGLVYFTISDYTSGSGAYPATITKTRATFDRNTTIKLDVTWE